MNMNGDSEMIDARQMESAPRVSRWDVGRPTMKIGDDAIAWLDETIAAAANERTAYGDIYRSFAEMAAKGLVEPYSQKDSEAAAKEGQRLLGAVQSAFNSLDLLPELEAADGATAALVGSRIIAVKLAKKQVDINKRGFTKEVEIVGELASSTTVRRQRVGLRAVELAGGADTPVFDAMRVDEALEELKAAEQSRQGRLADANA